MRSTPTERLIFPAPHLWIPTLWMSSLRNKGGHLVNCGGKMSCGCGSAICNGHSVPSMLYVDLGVGGWTNVSAAHCPSVSGIYAVGPVVAVGNRCLWQYNDYHFDNASGCDYPELQLGIGVGTSLFTDWTVSVSSLSNSVGDYVSYYSYPISILDIMTMDITISKYEADRHYVCATTGRKSCVGTLPATVRVFA